MDLFLERDAVISDCGLYRYLLRRVWDHRLPRLLVAMLNPSKADAEVDDATIRALYRLCRALGFGSFEVINLYGLRATDPDELAKAADPVGPGNDSVASTAINRCDMVVCAWGAHPMAGARAQSMVEAIRRKRPLAYCFGTTKAGAPKHPLYLKTGTPLTTYDAR